MIDRLRALVLGAVILSGVAAAAPDTLWLRHFVGDSAKRLNRAADIVVDRQRTAVYVCGSVENLVLSGGFWRPVTDMGVVCYNLSGQLQWRQAYGGNATTGSEGDMAHALALDSAGNVYVAGVTENNAPRLRDYSYCKYSPTGTALWTRKSLDANGDDALFDIAVGRNGQLYACGTRMDPASGLSGYLVVRLNPATGDTVWTRSYVLDTTAKSRQRRRKLHPDFLTVDYDEWDNCATAVAIDPSDGGVVTTGFGYDNLNDLYYEWWTMKHDTTGAVVWQTVSHTQNIGLIDDDDVAFDVVVDDSGYVYACGFTYWNAARDYEFAVMKFSRTGLRLYAREYGFNTEGDADAAYSLCLDNAVPQNLYVTGYIGYSTPLAWQIVTHKFVTTTMSRLWGTAGAVYDGGRANGDDAGYKVFWQNRRVYVAGVKGAGGGFSDDLLLLCYSDDDAALKDTLWTFSYDSPDSANVYEDYAAAVWVADSDNVYVAGQSQRDSLGRNWVSMVTARLYVPRPDAAVRAILAPTDTVVLGDSVRPRVLVQNRGNTQASFRSYFRFSDGYADSIEHFSLAPGDSVVDTFALWAPATAGPVVVRCSVGLAGDVVPANDLVVESVLVAVRDVGCTRIVAPAGIVDSGTLVTPRAWLANHGNVAEQFRVLFRVGDFWADTATVNLLPGDSVLTGFADVTLRQRGSWTAVCSTMLAGDRNRSNDRAETAVWVRVTDAALAAVEAIPDTVDSGSVLVPALRVANLGTDSGIVRCRLRMVRGAVVGYADSVDVALAPGVESLVGLAPSLPLGLLGDWQYGASVRLVGDQVPVNDSIGGDFIVVPAGGTVWPAGWFEVASVPPGGGRPVKDGGCLAAVELRDTAWVYALKGNKTAEFYRYRILGDSWQTRAVMPMGREGKPPGRGAALTEHSSGRVYAVKGNNTLGFWEYRPAADSWIQLADVPLGINGKKVKGGSDLVVVHDGGEDWVYLMKGYRNEFYRYRISSGTWQTLAEMPVGSNIKWYKGSFLVADRGRHIYAHKGKYNELWRYTVGTDSWVQRAALPLYNSAGRRKKSGDGASGAMWGGSIYALKGGNTNEFWRYDTVVDRWTELVADSLPSFGSSMRKKRVKGGSDLVASSWALWALKGNRTLEFWRWGIPLAGTSAPPQRQIQSKVVLSGSLERRFELTPNPARGRVYLCYSVSTPVRISVPCYDASGRLVAVAAERQLTRGRGAIELAVQSLPAGVYVVRPVTDDGMTMPGYKLVLR